jgi:hypothetical protein
MDPVAEAFVPMAGAVTGWKSARYGLPCTTPADRQHAFVVKTDDANHAISAAALGEFDAAAQQWVTAHPYPIGPRAEGVNAAQWSFVQAEALTFRLVAAKYAPAAKTVELGSFDLIEASDLQVRAVVDLPSPDCSVVFEIERADHSVIRLLPYQVVQLAEYVTETVALRAVLTGTQKLSPILYAPVMLVAGSIAAAGTYVSRAFDAGVAVDLVAYLKAFLPPGGSVTFSWDAADDDWHELAADSTDALAVQNWVEKKFSAADITAAQIRIKVAIAGGPAARVVAGDLGAGLKG